jgi:integrase
MPLYQSAPKLETFMMRPDLPATTIHHIAHHLVVSVCAHGVPKPRGESTEPKRIHSRGTERTYRAAIERFLEWRSEIGLDLSGQYRQDEMQQFLYELNDVYEQKQLETIRQAMQIVFKANLQKVISNRPTDLMSRAYSDEKLQVVLQRQSPRNQFSSRLGYAAGIRAHELLTIVPLKGENRPSDNRPWRTDLHSHREPVHLYIVTGKGGLKRSVGLPTQLAIELEQKLRAQPLSMVDREIKYKSWYDVAGGQALSQSFTNASTKSLGWSGGFHGLRHSYAQRRLRELRVAGISTDDALRIVSQELGHFRPDITLVYLR